MNSENPTPIIEKEPTFPSLEEIKAKMEQFCGTENLEFGRTLEDSNGIYLHEVITIKDGVNSYFDYQRKGNFGKIKSAVTQIQVGHFRGRQEDGDWMGGENLSEYDEMSGTWKDIK